MNKQSGFTLIELLVTLLTISILVALIASSFGLGLKSWTGVSKKVEVYQRVRVCLDMMSSRLQNAFISPLNKKLTFKGDRYSLGFVTTSSSKAGLTRVEFGAEKGLVEEFLGSEGLEQMQMGDEKSEKVFLDKGIESIEFMYYDLKDEQWKETWDSSERMCLPLAVKISLTFSTINERLEKITVPEVVVMIPGGMKLMKESVIQTVDHRHQTSD